MAIIRNYVSKWNLYLYFLTKQNLLISGEKMLMSPELERVCHVIHLFFGSSFGNYNCPNFHHCRICVTDFRKGDFLPLPLSFTAPKRPILNRVEIQISTQTIRPT